MVLYCLLPRGWLTFAPGAPSHEGAWNAISSTADGATVIHDSGIDSEIAVMGYPTSSVLGLLLADGGNVGASASVGLIGAALCVVRSNVSHPTVQEAARRSRSGPLE